IGFAVGRAYTCQEINVAAKLNTAAKVTCKHSLLLLLGHRPLVKVSALVCSEAVPILRFHQADAKLVEPITLARLLSVEDRCTWNVKVGLVERHLQISSGQYSRTGFWTSSLFCKSAAVAMCGMKSTRRPSSGMWSFRFGWGQSVPQSTRSGKVSTRRFANG